jgi:hypothetical protein
MDDGRFGDGFEAEAGDFALWLTACVWDEVLFGGLVGALGDLTGLFGSGSGCAAALGFDLRAAIRTGVLRTSNGDSALEMPPR